MNTSVQPISLVSLLIVSIPVLIVIGLYLYWSLDTKNAVYAFARMLVQLLLIGYVLKYIFEADQSWIVVVVLSVMLLMASWISLRTIKARRIELYRYSLVSITIGGVSTLAIVTQGVLQIQPWFWPQYMIPLAGMIFANAMTSISLAADRLLVEQDRGERYETARKTAMETALIPNINALFAVGLVSLPGMMTGQILSGVSPLIAARYQIMVMCMIFGSSGISVAVFLLLARNRLDAEATGAVS